MKNNLPYLIPDQDKNFNAALLILILFYLSKSDRGKLLINNERLLIFMYLIKNPIILGKMLEQIGRKSVQLSDTELFSIGSISVNLDPLFDSSWIKNLLKQVSARGFLKADYRKADGFMYSLSDAGISAASQLEGEYFERVRGFLRSLEQVKSESTKNLNQLLNNIFRL